MNSIAVADMLESADDASVNRLEVRMGMHISIDAHLVLRILLALVSILIITGTAAHWITFHVAPSSTHHLARLMHRFDLGFEPSIPNWYSSSALLASSGLLFLITLVKWRTGDLSRRHWLALAAGFFLMSMDEGVRLHEMVNTAMVMMKLNGIGLLLFPWAVLAVALVAIIGISFIPFLRRLDPRTRRLFLWSGAIYVLGAVAIDALGGVFVELYGLGSIYHTITQTTEETLEMVGVALFIYALLDHMRRQFGSIHFLLVAK